jgi:hypothetical protein
MTVPLDWVTDPTIQRNFDRLRELAVDTGGQSVGIRFGTGSVAYPGGDDNFPSEVVTHGLGTTPVVALVTSAGAGTFMAAHTLDSTDFTIDGGTIDGSSPAAATAVTYYWLVIG